jgi:hypothetical protein
MNRLCWSCTYVVSKSKQKSFVGPEFELELKKLVAADEQGTGVDCFKMEKCLNLLLLCIKIPREKNRKALAVWSTYKYIRIPSGDWSNGS